MAYSYKGYFRYIISSGGGGIGIPVIAFNSPDGGGFLPWRLANILNDEDVSGALYSSVSFGGLYLLLPDLLNDPGESENHGKFHDLRHLEQYSEKYGGSLEMSFSVEKYSNGKFISMYSLRDSAATVRSVDLVNQSYVWYTELILRLPNPTLLADGNRVAGGR
jgi:hypothetical protein